MSPERLDVTAWPVAVEEPLGANEKVWLYDPAGSSTDAANRWLFKPVTVHGNDHQQGGDWAELIASRVAEQLHVPSAEIRLSIRRGRTGTLSRNVRPDDGWSIYTGGLWMASRPDVAFKPRSTSTRASASPGYSLEAVRSSLEGVGAPPQAEAAVSDFDAFDVFAGILLLDAIVANRDRHEQNWSVLRPSIGRGQARIAAAYDNEGSLGYNLTDSRRARILEDRSMFDAYRRRGTAWRFDWDDAPNPSLIEAALSALSNGSTLAREFWQERARSFDLDGLRAEVASIPGMSDPQRTFAVNLIESNLKGVCDGF